MNTENKLKDGNGSDASTCSVVERAWNTYHGPMQIDGEDDYIPAVPPVFMRGFVDGYEHAKNKPVSGSWNPIATAPRDGSVFLAYCPHAAGGYQYVSVINGDGDILVMMTLDVVDKKPTHWMTLPENPTEPNVKGELPPS